MKSSSNPVNGGNPAVKSEKGSLSTLSLAMINIITVICLKNLTLTADYGLGSITIYILVTIGFVLPVALVAAELASTWPASGGIYRWVGEAFGKPAAFVAIWLMWVQSTIWFPTILIFGAETLAFTDPSIESARALAVNKTFVLIVCLVIYWLFTLINFRGFSIGAVISKWGGIIGAIIPAIMLFIMGIGYLATGGKLAMSTDPSTMIPKVHGIDSAILMVSAMLCFVGMEMNAVHINEVKNPAKTYPKAMIITVITLLTVFILGTLMVSFVIPEKNLSLTESLLTAFRRYLEYFGLGKLMPVLAILLALGVGASVSSWIAGPSKGLLVVGLSGMLPPFLQKTNKSGIQVSILIVQGLIVTGMVMLLQLMPSVAALYQVLVQLTALLYLLVYLLMFAAAIKLRKSQPDRVRPFKVPFGKYGMNLIAGLGFIVCLVAYVIFFFPPSQVSVGSNATWFTILITGNVVFVGLPLIIYRLKKPSWQNPDNKNLIEPFTWEEKGLSKPGK